MHNGTVVSALVGRAIGQGEPIDHVFRNAARPNLSHLEVVHVNLVNDALHHALEVDFMPFFHREHPFAFLIEIAQLAVVILEPCEGLQREVGLGIHDLVVVVNVKLARMEYCEYGQRTSVRVVRDGLVAFRHSYLLKDGADDTQVPAEQRVKMGNAHILNLLHDNLTDELGVLTIPWPE